MAERQTIEAIARSRGSRWRGPVLALLALAAAGAGFVVWRADADRAAMPAYVSEQAVRRDIRVTVTATGTVEPVSQVDISSELSGIVRTVNVDYNHEVKKGDVLAVLDTSRLEANVERARATLAARKAGLAEAEVTLAETRDNLARAQQLSDRGISSREATATARAAYERAVAAIETVKANILVAEADLKVEETQLEKACICSPIDGVVLDRTVEPGQIVAASLQAPILFRLAEDLKRMKLTVDIDEADIGQVAVGQTASFTVEAWRNRDFAASISELRYAPQTIEGVVTYRAILDVDNSELLLRPGMTATAEITTAEHAGVLTVPNAALRFLPPAEATGDSGSGLLGMILPRTPARDTVTGNAGDVQGSRTIWLLRDGAATETRIRIGATDGDVTEVTGGPVAEGDSVITGMARQ